MKLPVHFYFYGFWSLLVFVVIGLLIWRFRKPVTFKLLPKLLFGRRVEASFKQLFGELADRKFKLETAGQAAGSVVDRLTRVALVGLVLAVVPIWLLVQQNGLLRLQNDKFDLQNERINIQNNLIEADRRGTLVILLSSLLEQINTEIKSQRISRKTEDTIGFALSEPLIGQIISLSQGFLPYKFLEGDTLISRSVSLERGQLLLTLVNSRLSKQTYDKIFSRASFANSYLVGEKLDSAYLRGIDLRWADLRFARLNSTNLEFANLSETDLRGSYIIGTRFREADLRKSDLMRAKAESTISESLLEAKSLYGIHGLDLHISNKIQELRPCLFDQAGCK